MTLLELIYGGAGCGKTTYARKLACDTALGGKRAVMLVPEQFSFETERAMLELLGAKDAQKVRVYSFTRLAEEVSRITASSSGRRLDDCGRVAAMGAALSMLGGQLDLYGGRQPSANFIDHLLDAVKEFKLCAITPAMLERTAQQASGTLKKKLTELSAIFSAYEAVVGQTSLDPMDDLTRLHEQLGVTRFFDGAVVILDSFRGFTGQEMKVISQIIRQADRCVITILSETADRSADNGLFETSLRTAETLKAAAKDEGIAVAPSVQLGNRHRFSSEAIAAVESGVFRYGRRPETFTDLTGDVTIYEADSRYGEMEFCARECRRLMREEGYRCRDIAIIARAESTYSDMAYDALTMQDIPCFLDRRTDASSCALMQFVLASLDIVCRGWQCDDLMRWLKTGLVGGIGISDIAEAENYCFVWSISGREWHRPFTLSPGGFGTQMSEEEALMLERINTVRERTVSLLDAFSAELENADGAHMAEALFRLLEEAGVPEQLELLCGRLDEASAHEQEQLWNSLMSILDQSALILGGRSLTKENFAAYISLMINRCDTGSIPRGLDDVVFGGADRMRVTAPRAVFIVGAVDGEFPAAPAGSGVFTDDERKRLHDELMLPVAEPAEHQMLEERLMAYSALSAASEKLYITYPRRGDSDKAVFPSECIAEVLKCVPKAKRMTYSERLEIQNIEAPNAAFELAARYWNSGAEAASLAAELSKDEAAAQRLRAVEASAENALPSLSGSRAASAMFGGNMRISPSQAEQFYRCRFGYFCRYGMQVTPRTRAALDTLRYGSIVHYVLEHILGGIGTEPVSVLTNDRADTEQRVAALLEDYLNSEMGGREGKEASLLYRLDRMRYSLTELVLNIAEELSVSDFRPVAYEMSIDRGGDVEPSYMKLANGKTLSVRGIVDRVDCWRSDGRTYIRIIDYKTGGKNFVLSDVADGLNMQMLIYAGEICREDNGRFADAVPAGILYCPAYSGTISDERDVEDSSLASTRSSQLRRRGIIVDGTEDNAVCNAMENGLGGRFIPVRVTGKGKLDSYSPKHLITPAGYEIVGRYVRSRLVNMCDELAQGHISPDPAANGRIPVCSSCDYRAICRYEGKMRSVYKGSNEEALMKMADALRGEAD